MSFLWVDLSNHGSLWPTVHTHGRMSTPTWSYSCIDRSDGLGRRLSSKLASTQTPILSFHVQKFGDGFRECCRHDKSLQHCNTLLSTPTHLVIQWPYWQSINLLNISFLSFLFFTKLHTSLERTRGITKHFQKQFHSKRSRLPRHLFIHG
jgi:hypothetical protein